MGTRKCRGGAQIFVEAEGGGFGTEACQALVDRRAMKAGPAGSFGNIAVGHDLGAQAQGGCELSDEALNIDAEAQIVLHMGRLLITAWHEGLFRQLDGACFFPIIGRRGVDRDLLAFSAQPGAGARQCGDPVVDYMFGEGLEARTSGVMAPDPAEQVEHEILFEILAVHAGDGILTVEFRCEVADALDGASGKARIAIESVQVSSPLSR